MDSFSFKISLQVLVTFVICMLVIIGIIRDGDKMNLYIQIYLTWGYLPTSSSNLQNMEF